MLVALSGAQGSGKTTVLNNLKTLGFNLVERKTARSILSEWNTTLDKVYRDPTQCVAFQDECLIRKIADEQEAIESDKLWFTERSYADVFTYPLLTVSKYNEYNSWVDEYYEKCAVQQKKYLAVVYFEGGAFKPEDDGVRGFNQHYVRLVDQTLFTILQKMSSFGDVGYGGKPPIFVIPKHYSTVDDRTRQVAQQCQELWLRVRLPEKQLQYTTISSRVARDNEAI